MAIAYNTSIVRNGLVLHVDAANPKSYPGTGTVWTDLSGQGLNAVLANSPTYSSSSFSFNGTNQYASIAYTPTLAPTVAISYEAWAYLPNWNITPDIKVISKTEAGGYQIGLNEPTIGAGNIGTILFLGGAYRTARIARTTLTPGWHHLAFTCDGRYLRMYLDSVNVNTYDHGTTAAISYATNNHFLIGAEPGSGTVVAGSYWTGQISNVKIYNRGLTAQEIFQNFDAHRGRFGI